MFTIGQRLILTSGSPDQESYLKAKVMVVTPSPYTCLVRVTEILDRGTADTTYDGEELAVPNAELVVVPGGG